MKSNMKDVKLLRCWIHLFKSIERWLHSHNYTIAETSYFLTSIREFLLSSTREEFESELKLRYNLHGKYIITDCEIGI